MLQAKVWVPLCVLWGGVLAMADQPPLDCAKKSLAQAVANTDDSNKTITFTGICQGPVVIRTDGLALQGVGTAIIDGNRTDAVTVAGAHAISWQMWKFGTGRTASSASTERTSR